MKYYLKVANQNEKNLKNKKTIIDTKNTNKLLLGLEAEKSKEKARQNSYNGLIKTEETHSLKKNISINKKSFLAKTNNLALYNAKSKKDIFINNENINNNIPKNKNISQNREISSKNTQVKTLIKVCEKNKKFKRTFSGYGIRRKSSMNNKATPKNYNITISKIKKSNNSHHKQKEQITINSSIRNNNNAIISNKIIISKSANKC